MSFIGIAINIWRDTYGGGGAPPIGALVDRFGNLIVDRSNIVIINIPQG